MARLDLINAHVAHCRVVEAAGLAGGWLMEAHGSDPVGALQETERACDRIIAAARQLRSEAMRQRYRAMSGRQLDHIARTGSDEEVASIADLDARDRLGR